MLILSRRPGESLTIGDDVVVTVVGVKGNQIRLGITAPREVRVLRDEVHRDMWDKSQAANGPTYNRRFHPTKQFRGRKQIKSGDSSL
jgi:carbon storage regulator